MEKNSPRTWQTLRGKSSKAEGQRYARVVDSGWAKLKIEAAAAESYSPRIDSGRDVIVVA
jgi:hypothetical protein